MQNKPQVFADYTRHRSHRWKIASGMGESVSSMLFHVLKEACDKLGLSLEEATADDKLAESVEITRCILPKDADVVDADFQEVILL